MYVARMYWKKISISIVYLVSRKFLWDIRVYFYLEILVGIYYRSHFYIFFDG